MRQNPLNEMIDCENTPKFKDGSNFGVVVIHEELEGIERGDIESQQLANLFQSYLMNNMIP